LKIDPCRSGAKKNGRNLRPNKNQSILGMQIVWMPRTIGCPLDVDPGYSGKLIFAVFNSGPTRINLRRGDDIFSIWLADVTHKAKERKHGYYHIPSKLVNQIDGRHQTAYQLNEKIEKVERELFYTKIVAALAALLLVFPAAKDLISNGSLDLISNEEVVQDAVEMETTGAAGTTGAVVPSHQLNGESK
jgi:dCTP deaminase